MNHLQEVFMKHSAHAWVMREPGTPLCLTEFTPQSPATGEALIEIAGCGVCHTDIGFLHDGVPTRHPLPLTLGHEIAGTISQVGPNPTLHDGRSVEPGQQVIVPAVLPCGACGFCRKGRENMCPAQKMPGNDMDGGFATHITVPIRFLVPVTKVPPGHDLAHLAVVADAVTTPYQALRRALVSAADRVVIIGAGGIGIYGVQIAAAMGSQVIAVDVVDKAMQRTRSFGAHAAVCTAQMDGKEARDAVRRAAADLGWPRAAWKIFEMSGSRGGQELAFSLLSPGATLAVVGYTPRTVSVRLSNLMAFDADAFGSWGCRPQYYADVLDLIATGKVKVEPFVKFHPLADINAVLDKTRAGRLDARAVLLPAALEKRS
jgi:6-hydroxycyclohex-1-ene-1-carbonyl-CoA dehydrogenase